MENNQSNAAAFRKAIKTRRRYIQRESHYVLISECYHTIVEKNINIHHQTINRHHQKADSKSCCGSISHTRVHFSNLFLFVL